MTKPPSLKKQKIKTWVAFSAYIRTRDCVAYLKVHPELNELMAACFTCKRVYEYKKLQAGHFVPGRTNAILFDERGVHAQCYGCNVGRSGEVIRYYPIMVEKYGQEVVDDLIRLKNTTVKFTIDDLKTMALDYQMRTYKLLYIFKHP